MRRQRWWSMQHRASGKPVPEQECLDQLDELMSEATRLRLIADVPVGALLSGGDRIKPRRELHGRGWFDRVLDSHLTGSDDHTPRLWNLAMLELWQRK